MKREFLQNLKVGENSLPKEIIDAIMAQNGQDIESAKQSGRDWEEKYNQAVAQHAAQMRKVQLQAALETAVTKAGGRNQKAIAALLDLDSLENSEDLPAALEQALEQVRKDCGYLFESAVPPQYSPNTGVTAGGGFSGPVTLAGALRERNSKS